jgi:hypothetical protein
MNNQSSLVADQVARTEQAIEVTAQPPMPPIRSAQELWRFPKVDSLWQVKGSFDGSSWAAFDEPDRQYRYGLGRAVRRTPATVEGRRMLFVMLNPSTADAAVDDPTIRRCLGFAAREGCSHLVVVNLFAYRAVNPAELDEVGDLAVGAGNETALAVALEPGPGETILVAAWGANRPAGQGEYMDRMRNAFAANGAVCLGTTKDGHPKHPVRLRAGAELVPLEPVDRT